MLNLFDLTSTSFTSNAFLLDNQVTLFATGLPDDGEVRFEIVTFRDTPLETVDINCGVCAEPCASGGFPTSELVIVGTQRLTCGSCSTDPNNNQVKLTSASSYIVLDAPIGSYIRAVYVGVGLGTFTVGFNRSNTGNLTPAMRGCCPLIADLQVVKTANKTHYKTDETVVYTVAAVNAGPANANGAKLYDSLPADFTVDSVASTYANGAVGPVVTNRAEMVEVTLAVFPSGGTATFTVTGRYALPGYYDNTASIAPPFGIVDSKQDNNESNAPITVRARTAALQLVKTVNDPNPLLGAGGTYTLTVTNNGPDEELNITVTDALPVGLTYGTTCTVTAVNATGAPATVLTSALAIGVVVATQLEVGGSISISVPFTVPASAADYAFLNTARVRGTRSENSAYSLVHPRTPPIPQADVQVTKTVSAPVPVVGNDVTFTVTVFNAGPADANGTVLTDVLPAQFVSPTINAVFAGGAASAAPTGASLAVGWSIATLPAGGSVTLTVTDTVTVSAALLNTATALVPPTRVDPNLANNTATASVFIRTEALLRCNGAELQPADRVLVLGDLKKCVGGVVTPLACGDIVQVLANCATPAAETLVWMSNPASMLRAGVCIASLNPTYSANLRAIGSFRTLASLDGNFGFSGANPGEYAQVTYTNTTGTQVLVEATLTGRGNAYAFAGSGTMGFIFNVGTNLNIDPDNGFADQRNPGFSRGILVLRGPDGYGAGGQYQDVTIDGAKFTTLLAAGASVTVYGQAWGVLFQNDPLPNGIVVHAGFDMQLKVTRNGAYL